MTIIIKINKFLKIQKYKNKGIKLIITSNYKNYKIIRIEPYELELLLYIIKIILKKE